VATISALQGAANIWQWKCLRLAAASGTRCCNSDRNASSTCSDVMITPRWLWKNGGWRMCGKGTVSHTPSFSRPTEHTNNQSEVCYESNICAWL
jgi:hypothetical protein